MLRSINNHSSSDPSSERSQTPEPASPSLSLIDVISPYVNSLSITGESSDLENNTMTDRRIEIGSAPYEVVSFNEEFSAGSLSSFYFPCKDTLFAYLKERVFIPQDEDIVLNAIAEQFAHKKGTNEPKDLLIHLSLVFKDLGWRNGPELADAIGDLYDNLKEMYEISAEIAPKQKQIQNYFEKRCPLNFPEKAEILNYLRESCCDSNTLPSLEESLEAVAERFANTKKIGLMGVIVSLTLMVDDMGFRESPNLSELVSILGGNLFGMCSG